MTDQPERIPLGEIYSRQLDDVLDAWLAAVPADTEGWYDAGTFEPGDGPTLTAYTYLPPDPEPEPARQPALWNGRPIPGKCTIDGCPNQATSMLGYWDGGAPGVGTWQQQGRCPQHDLRIEPED